MRRKIFRTQSDYDWLLDEFGFEWVFQRMLDAHSPQEVAQKAFGVDSPVDAAFKLLQTSPEGRELLKRLKEEEGLLVE